MGLFDIINKRAAAQKVEDTASPVKVHKARQEAKVDVDAVKARVLAAAAKARASAEQQAVNDAESEQAISKGAKLLAMLKKQKELNELKVPTHLKAEVKTIAPELVKSAEAHQLGKHEITYDMLNDKQREAVDYGSQGKSFCLIGSAGSGKTTTQRLTVQAVEDSGTIGVIEESTKMLARGAPSILICSFMNKAVENMRAALPHIYKGSCMTIHKAIEYAPDEELRMVIDPDTQEEYEKTVRVFKPQRNKDCKLPHIDLIIMEESSTVGEDLYDKLVAALPNPDQTTFIFLGDLNQLPPVFGDAVLGFKLSQLPVVELTEVYRQEGESPIKALALDILKGAPLRDSQMKERYHKDLPSGKCNVVPFKKRIEPEQAVKMIGMQLGLLMKKGVLIPGEDMVLCPYNGGGSVNTQELNRWMAQAWTDMHNLLVYEIIAGRDKYYLSEGDIVYFRKKSWKVEAITKNDSYGGKPYAEPSYTMDRWGRDEAGKDMHYSAEELLMQEVIMEDEKDSNASHEIMLSPVDQGEDTAGSSIRTVGDFSDFQLGYSLTVYKSIGSEWRHVLLVLHHEHASQMNRETLYTAVTRARRELTLYFAGEDRSRMVCNSSWFQAGIINQQIKGRTLQAKINYFNEKRMAKEKGEEVKAAIKAQAEARKNQIIEQAHKQLDNHGVENYGQQ